MNRGGHINTIMAIFLVFLLQGCVAGKDDSQHGLEGKARAGKWVYVSGNGSSDITFLWYEPITKRLDKIATYPTGKNPFQLIVTQGYLYAANSGSDTISIFSVNKSTGELNFIADQISPGIPNSFAVDPTSNILYVSHHGAHMVISYRIDKNTGLLSELDRTTRDLNRPISLEISPDQTRLFVVNQTGLGVTSFDLSSDGQFSRSNFPPQIVGPDPFQYVFNTEQDVAYFGNFISGVISSVGFSLNSLFTWSNPTQNFYLFPAGTAPAGMTKHPVWNVLFVGGAGTGKIYALKPPLNNPFGLVSTGTPFQYDLVTELRGSRPSVLEFLDPDTLIAIDATPNSKLVIFDVSGNAATPSLSYRSHIQTPVLNLSLVVVDGPQ